MVRTSSRLLCNPPEVHLCQTKKCIEAEGYRVMEVWLHREAFRLRASQPQSTVGLVQAACFDSTYLRSLSSRDLDDNKWGRGKPDVRVVI